MVWYHNLFQLQRARYSAFTPAPPTEGSLTCSITVILAHLDAAVFLAVTTEKVLREVHNPGFLSDTSTV